MLKGNVHDNYAEVISRSLLLAIMITLGMLHTEWIEGLLSY